MAVIKLEHLKPGMVLSKAAIHEGSGREIMPSGKRLEEKDIRTLKSWGIDQIHVEGGEQEMVNISATATLVDTGAVTDRLREAFRFTDPNHPLIIELYRLSQLSYAEYLSRHTGAGRA